MSIFRKFKGKKQAVAIGLGIVLGVAGLAKAMVVTNGCASVSECTLTELIGGGSIMVDDVSFTGFQAFSNPMVPNPGSIFVSGLGVGTSDVGLRFSDLGRNWITNNTLFHDINYFVSVSGGKSIISQSLSFGANTSILGNLLIVETSLFPGGRTTEIIPSSPSDFQDGFMETGFNAFTSIGLTGFNNTLAGIGGFDQTFGLRMAAVPIPAAVWLFGSAVMLIVGFRKRPDYAVA